jgi:hypothetical protein
MYVSAELMRRGWLGTMTARGSRSFATKALIDALDIAQESAGDIEIA